MKKIKFNLISAAFIAALSVGCTADLEEINTDPNNPVIVQTSSLMTNAQKGLFDDIYDEWFSGRGSYLYAQYFAQRNYTSEDRYQIRDNVNNSYWIYIYGDIMDLQEVIELNNKQTVPYANQIAAARILKAWAVQILTDTYGDIPYFEAFKGQANVTPAYTPQEEIYADLLKELTEAAAQIDVTQPVFAQGDVIYDGDAAHWKKFANSLKMRVAIRLSKVDPNYKTYINEALAGGVFESNDDNATFRFLPATPNAAPLYDAFFTSNRNDFTLSKPFVDLLKGANDDANGKTNPFEGLVDPRLHVWASPKNGEYRGMPYGIPDAMTAAARPGTIDLMDATIITSPTLALTYMDYAEVCFILSEVNNWDQTWYEKGVEASLEHWGDEATVYGNLPSDYTTQVENYLNALPAASEENVLTQKYIALFLQGFEAWSELRRTGYPHTVVHPGEINYVSGNGTAFRFTPAVGNEIPSRVTYPEVEQNLNPTSYSTVVSRIGADAMATKVWWDRD